MLKNGSEILVECLKEQGVKTMFGFPGGAVLNIYDALYKSGEIRHILTSHEQGAAHAADGFARATGKTGVCLATSGPGATNLVTGIATAYMDSSPVVALTGNVALPLLGKDSFQEVDIAGITMPITKHGFIVKKVDDLADTVRKAFYIAREGRPGPVLVDITKDATANMCEYTPQTPREITRKGVISEKELSRAADIIKKAAKPLIYAGGGVINAEAHAELAAFADKIDAPVCVSAMGIGAFAASNPRFIGMVGMHGFKAANLAVTNCDLLIAVGARFSDRVVSNVKKFAPHALILHLDIDPAEINKNVKAAAAVTGDAKSSLDALNAMLDDYAHDEWNKRVAGWKGEFPVRYKDDDYLRPQHIMSKINEFSLKNASVIVTEVGQHQMWACHYIKRDEPRTFITSGGLGTMGFGLGAAIGAKVGRPEKTVFNIAGDGCFRMNNIELATAVANDIPIIEVIFNNHALGMVRQWQKLFYGGRFSQTTLDKTADFVKLAEAYGALGINVREKSEVEAAIYKAAESGRAAVINCELGADDDVFPMVSPGAGIDEVVTE